MVTKRTPKELHKKSKELYWNIRNIGKNGQSSKWAYYYCMCILNGKKDVPRKFAQADAPNVTGQSVNITLTKKEYLDKMKAYCLWVEKHKSLPNYVTIKDKKVKPKIWNAYVGYLFKVYYETGKLPASQPIKSNIYTDKSKPILYDYMTNEGCSGMGQCTAYNCGPNSLQQCFYRLTGIKVDESTIASWAATTTDGTDHDGLNTAVAMFNKKYNKTVKITWKNFSELGNNEDERWNKLSELIKNGAVFCHLNYRNTWGHYEVPKAVYGSTLDILNSLGDRCNYPAYCGYIENRSKSEQRSYINGISQKSIAILTI